MSSKENPEDIEQKIFGVKDSQETYVPISTKKIKKIIIFLLLFEISYMVFMGLFYLKFLAF